MKAEKTIIKRIAKAVVISALAFVFLLNFAVFLFGVIDKDNRFEFFPGALLVIDSGSMEPKLSEGDLIFVWETRYDELRPGDIITFHHGDTLVTHEVVDVRGENAVITQGAANTVEDEVVTRDKYCAKMLFALSGCGWIMDILTSPVLLVLLGLAIFILFFGEKIFAWLYIRIKKSSESRIKRPGAVRIAACVSVLSFLLSYPMITAAKYVDNVYRYESVSASAIYFQSNYLSESGNSYTVQNWDGNTYRMTVKMRNFVNDLLYNDNDVDVDYGFRIEKVSEAGYLAPGDYKIDFEAGDGANVYSGNSFTAPTSFPGTHNSGNVTTDVEGVFTFFEEGGDSEKKSADFRLEIGSTSGEPLPAFQDADETVQTQVKFRIYAYTSTADKYFRTLWGEFVLKVTEVNTSFITEMNISQTSGNKLVTLDLKTGLTRGSTSKTVRIKWRSEKLYIDEYNATFINLINKMGGVYDKDCDDGFSYLTVELQAYSFVKLDFIKRNSDEIINSDTANPDLTAEELEED